MIELLVAISIISILGAISLMAYGSIQKNNRDQERVRELTAIKQALEFYRSDQYYYPTVLPAVGQSLLSPDGYKKYLEAVPQDPSSDRAYFYQPQSSTGGACDNNDNGTPCSSFLLCGAKERTDDFYALSECDSFYCDTAGNTIHCSMGLSSD